MRGWGNEVFSTLATVCTNMRSFIDSFKTKYEEIFVFIFYEKDYTPYIGYV